MTARLARVAPTAALPNSVHLIMIVGAIVSIYVFAVTVLGSRLRIISVVRGSITATSLPVVLVGRLRISRALVPLS